VIRLATALAHLRAIASQDASHHLPEGDDEDWLELHLRRNAGVVSLEFKEDKLVNIFADCFFSQ
jgi:hypothetical protein